MIGQLSIQDIGPMCKKHSVQLQVKLFSETTQSAEVDCKEESVTVQGVGMQYLSDVLIVTSPTHVVMLQSKSARKNLPGHAFWLDPAKPLRVDTKFLAVPGVGGQGLAEKTEATSSGEALNLKELIRRPLATRPCKPQVTFPDLIFRQ